MQTLIDNLLTETQIEKTPDWIQFWNKLNVMVKHGPLVGLINSDDDRRPIAVISLNNHGMVWNSNIRTQSTFKSIIYDSFNSLFTDGAKPLSPAQMTAVCENLLKLITDHRVAWLALSKKSKKNSGLGRNLYWNKIAASLAEKIGVTYETEVVAVGTPQHLILNGVLDGLSHLRKCSVFLNTVDPSIPWNSMLFEKTPLDTFVATSIFDKTFNKETQNTLASGTVSVAGKVLPVDVVYDLYCEFSQPSLIKRQIAKLEAKWFGVASSSNDGERQFFWSTVGTSFEEFSAQLNQVIASLISDLSIAQMLTISERINAIPISFLPLTSDETKQKLLLELNVVNQKLTGLLGFIEWNCELFPDLKTVKKIISGAIDRVDQGVKTLQSQDKASETLAGKIESTRSRIQFSLHLVTEKIAEIHSQSVLEKISEIVSEVETIIRKE